MNKPSFKSTLFYHDIFDYPLTKKELEKWKPGKLFPVINRRLTVGRKGRFFFLKGREKIVKLRLEKEVHSRKKMRIARRAARILGKISTVKFIGVTGSLAMQAAGKRSDIDLMVITTKGCLWTTRLISYFATALGGIKRRKAGEGEEKDRVCLNIWLDETDLVWRKKNVYTAHEIAQIMPIVNKEGMYERFVRANKWIMGYWTNAVIVNDTTINPRGLGVVTFLCSLAELFAYSLQRIYMRPKMTREVVTPTRALFHPVEWSRKVKGVFRGQFPAR